MSTDRKSLLFLIIIMCILWIASLVVISGVISNPPGDIGKQENLALTATPTTIIYQPPTPTNTRVVIMIELTPGKSEFIEMLPTLPPNPDFTPVPGVTSNAKQIPAPIDIKELDIYEEIQK